MVFRINQDLCIGCGDCADGCPMGCITEDAGKMVINEDDCIGCGTCEDTCSKACIECVN